MKNYPKVTIIIPLYKKTPYLYEAVSKCLEVDYPNYEVLIGVDKEVNLDYSDKRVKLVQTGGLRTGPAEKRDIAIIKAKGEYIAFLDDDSYPSKNWLKEAIKYLTQKKISTVCGPGLTPPGDNFWQQVTGAVLGSWFGSGPYRYRFIQDAPRFVDDYPAYNMIIQRDVLLKIGGFGTKYYGGEDTAICIKLINNGEKIYYHPDIIVYHHRRKFPFEYGRQVGNVGLHRGYFVKAYPQTSFRISYFGPIILIFMGLISIFITIIYTPILPLVLTLLIMVYLLIFFEGLGKSSLLINTILPIAVIYNHLAYGINFLKGLLLTRNLER